MKKLFNLCSPTLALLLCLGALPARAANYVVTNLNDSGQGSLRAAVASSAATAEDDKITFEVNGTIVLQSVLDWGKFSSPTGSLFIDGTGQSITISGNNAVPVLTRASGSQLGTTLTLKTLTIANGKSSGGKAVVNAEHSNLQVIDCVFFGHSVSEQAVIQAGANGLETLTVTNSRFFNNSSSGNAQATAIFISSLTSITNSSFESNVGTSAAVLAQGSPSRKLTIVGSTFTGNASSINTVGGGAVGTGVPTTIINSTFHANSTAGVGGAVNAVGSSFAPLTVINSTFSGNVSGSGGAVAASKGAQVTLRNSIVANSTGGNCGAGVVDGGGNLSDDMSCNFTAASSLNGTAAQLGPLADNGGPTKTMIPLTGSSAIDQGVNALALDAAGLALTTDQRGSARVSPSGGTVDRGAVELLVIPPPVLNTCPAATAQVGVAYSSALGASGGTAPNRFSITGNLPTSLVLNPTTGALTGMLMKPGSYAFTATVADSASPTSRSSSKACSITVAEAANVGPLIVTPTRLAFGVVPAPATLLKQVVTLKNIGPTSVPGVKSGWVPVTIGPVSVTPDAGTAANAFTVVNTCPASLNVGQSCTIVVTAGASPSGPRSATLNIPNNAPASPQTVALSASAAP